MKKALLHQMIALDSSAIWSNSGDGIGHDIATNIFMSEFTVGLPMITEDLGGAPVFQLALPHPLDVG